jgi:hypothetical protein
VPNMKTTALMVVSLAVVSSTLAQENASKWPRALELEQAMVVYQPQLETAEDRSTDDHLLSLGHRLPGLIGVVTVYLCNDVRGVRA